MHKNSNTYFRTVSMGCDYVIVLWKFPDSINLQGVFTFMANNINHFDNGANIQSHRLLEHRL